MPKPMVRVETAEQIAALVTPLEQAVLRIQVKVVKEDAQLPFNHHIMVVSSLWVEQAVPVW